ncbi:MAG: hypothetical protein WCS65_05710 [Verrucomicrobiae bacterium]
MLCLPALFLGGWLRFEMAQTLPVIFYGSDSHSYFRSVVDLWTCGALHVPEKRRWLYPLFLLPLPLSPFSPSATLAAIQHIIGLLVVVPIGWIVGHVTRFRAVWIPAATALYAVWPNALWYEQELIAETALLAAFVTTVALAFPLERLERKQNIFLFLAGAGAIGLLKTLGKPIWAVLVVFLLLVNRRPLAWGRRSLLVLAASVVLVATSGASGQGSWLFLSSTLPFLPPEGSWPEYRNLLRPLVLKAREDLPNYAFRQRFFKKTLDCGDDSSPLGPEWVALLRDKKKFYSVTKSLAISAFLNNPYGCARLSIERFFIAGETNRQPRAEFDPARFHKAMVEENSLRWQEKPVELELLFRMSQVGFENWTASFPPIHPSANALLRWTADFFSWGVARQGGAGKPPIFGIRWPGWLVLLGLLFCLAPGRAFAFLPVWAPSLVYVAACFSVGDAIGQYLQPVEWTGIVLAAIALDSLLTFPGWILARRAATASSADQSGRPGGR